ncbi:MAG TPA: hypothetical protein VHC69_01050 [Polyangiaceae bacterium]|nr:hypothetical protein [Polyangiaceae bacterium]
MSRSQREQYAPMEGFPSLVHPKDANNIRTWWDAERTVEVLLMGHQHAKS